jgi:hypothetical protein
VLHGLHGVAKSLERGELALAAIRLAQAGLPVLRGPRDADMLKLGADFLANGFSPWAILQAAGLDGPQVRLAKDAWDEGKHPRDPATGQFVPTGGAEQGHVAISASAAAALIARGATPISAGDMARHLGSLAARAWEAYGLPGGALLVLTAAGWVLTHGPKGDIADGPSYWLPGVANENSGEQNEGGSAPPAPATSTPGDPCQGDPACDPKQNQSAADRSKSPSYKIGESDGGPGKWAVANDSMSEEAAAYQEKATGTPRGLSYDVPNPWSKSGITSFDGYEPAPNTVLDAKRFIDWPIDKCPSGKKLNRMNRM